MRPSRKTIAGVQPERLTDLQRLLGRYQLTGWPKDTTEIEALTEAITYGESA